jgi:hypothetical protein
MLSCLEGWWNLDGRWSVAAAEKLELKLHRSAARTLRVLGRQGTFRELAGLGLYRSFTRPAARPTRELNKSRH